MLRGYPKSAVQFLQISQRRAKLNGLDSPASVVISPHVRLEMERALADLQEMILTDEAELAVDDRSE